MKENLRRNCRRAATLRLSQGAPAHDACREVQEARRHLIDTPGAYPGLGAEERGRMKHREEPA